MKVFVTGGSGFVGAHTTMALLDAGHAVRLLVRNRDAADNYFSQRGYRIDDYVVSDMLDTDRVVEGMAGCDAFFHAAAMVSVDAGQAEAIRRTNQGTIRALMQGALDNGIENIVYVSSLIALFSPGVSRLDETAPLGTLRSPYAASKRECDAYVRELQAQGAPVQITYASGVFGPDDPKLSESNEALISFLSNVPNTESGIQCVDVRDVAAAHRFLLEHPVAAGGDNSDARFILGGHFYTWPEFHRLLCEVTGRDIKNPRMPGAVLRGIGRTLDLVRKFRPVGGMMTTESMQVCTRFPVADSRRIVEKAGLVFRPGAETFTDTLAWLAGAGHIKPKWAGLESTVNSVVALVLLAGCLLTASPLSAGDTYSPGGWPTLHQDAGNRRAVDAAVLGRDYRSWRALEGATVLTAPTTSPDGRQLYVTTGLAAGQSNLHALSVGGDLLWQSEPWQTPGDGIDPCALLSSPIVDRDGDLYIGDCNQLFAFRPDGANKWVIDLPAVQAEDWQPAGDHPVNALTTAAFTADGDILGVTNFGDVIIVDRATGAVLNQPYRLPGLIPPYSTVVPMPDSLLANGMMDPRFKEWAWQLIFGGKMRSANTPAVAADGRLFVVGSGRKEGVGALYGLDIVGEGKHLRIEEAFSTGIGLGSGSSPALSPDEQQVYVSDEEGWFYGLDANTGEIRWKVQTKAAAGAAGVGRDGTIYALQGNAPAVVAISPRGRVLWESDFSEQVKTLPSSWLLGEPVTVGNGNPSITGDAILVPIIFGYGVPLPGFDFALPVKSTVAAIDRETGIGVGDVVDLPDDSSGITAVLADGTIVNSLGGVLTSSISPLKTVADYLLPGGLTMMESEGGLQVSVPVDRPGSADPAQQGRYRSK